ncbi:MAG: TonB-dependent receptor, partial [Bacteroidota bacterium]
QGINLEANVAFGSKWLLQSGATIQSATYEEAETLWSPAEDDPRAPTTTTRLLRTPDVYGFLTAVYTPIRPLQLSVSGVFTGPMDVPRVVDVDTEYTIIERSPSFMEVNLKAAYTFEFGEQYDLELFGGVQNLFNSFQEDFDRGADRDSNYVYGPNRPLTIFTGVKFGLN